MEDKWNDIDWIDGYLGSSLSEEKRQWVEMRLESEPEFKLKFLSQKQLAQGIRYAHLAEKLEQLRLLESGLKKNYNEKKEVKMTAWVPYAVAASILISFGVWFFLVRETIPLNEKLYARHFEPFDSPGSGLTRGSDDSITLKVRAYVEYDKGNYAGAAKLFEQFLDKNDDPIAHLCLGNAYMANGDLAKAEENFQHMLKEHNDLVTQTKWYLALTYMKQGKLERTKATLWEISKSSTYGEKAKRLIKDLD
jgi:tetratricopeptide (TPR) repeat protein